MNKFTSIFVLIVLVLSAGSLIAQDVSVGLGKISYVGSDYNVYSVDLVNNNQQYQLTTDGSISHRYQWPTWSDDGRLAYFCCDPQFVRGQISAQIFISPDGIANGTEVYNEPDTGIVYAYWSPEDCQDANECRELAVLVNNFFREGLSVEIIQDSSNGIATEIIGDGSPFYYSWSPNGEQMIWHRFGQQIDIYEISSNQITSSLPRSSGTYLAPSWSPVDDRILYGVIGDQPLTSNLVVGGNGIDQQILIQEFSGFIAFLWSPDGNYVAYRLITAEGQLGPVYVVDTITGNIVARTTSEQAIAFFWSPDSQKIAYMTPPSDEGAFSASAKQLAPLEQRNVFTWHVLDVASGIDTVHANFSPTGEMVYLLLYFDQFAQSHRIWSPDSSHIVYSEVTDDDDGNPEATISILDITQANTVPLTIAGGVFAIWSFE